MATATTTGVVHVPDILPIPESKIIELEVHMFSGVEERDGGDQAALGECLGPLPLGRLWVEPGLGRTPVGRRVFVWRVAPGHDAEGNRTAPRPT